MIMQLGENPWLLIGLTFLEILFIIIPALITGKVEKRPFNIVIKEMGFQKTEKKFLKIILGINFGIGFYFISIYISTFFRDLIIKNLFSSDFVEQAQEGLINTVTIQPSLIQLIILILLQIFIVGPCEEAFFRGFLIKKMEIKLKLTYSVIISSVFFTFYHIPPFIVPISTIITFFGYYFAFGVLLSLIFVFSDYSLLICSVTHSFFNVLLLLI
ncbi:MAG: lysostaphin resistance A-like protein [Candidatus Thorarchaeota archaeon]